MIKKILYWLMVLVIVVGAVYSYNKVGFARKTAMVFQTIFGEDGAMGPGGRPPMGRNMQEGQGPGMPPDGERGQFQPGEGGRQGAPQVMEQNTQGGQAPGITPEGVQGQYQQVEGASQGIPQTGQSMQGGQAPVFQGGERGRMAPQGGMNRAGGPVGPGGVISLREVIPYTFIFAFFVLITCMIEGTVKRFFRSKSA